MNMDDIKALIESALPGSEVHLRDFTGGGDHLEANIVWSGFEGLSRIQQHRAVYEALGEHMGGAIHAFSMKTHSKRPEYLDSPADAYGG